jgi:hypothetical protein
LNRLPRAVAAFRHRERLAWFVPAAVAGSFAFLHGTAGGDTNLFVTAGRTLLSTHWSHAFANSEIQVGPLQLAVFGSIGRSATALAVVLAITTVLLLLAAARTVGVRNPLLLGALGLIAVAVGFTSAGYVYGHPADAVLPLLWILAAVDVRRGHAVRAGALVGLTAGFQTWGLLGVAVLALAPRWRDAGKAVLAAAGVAALLFVPFVLGGHFAMGSYSWNVDSQTFLSLLVTPGVQYGWSLRLLLGAFAVSAGVGAARLLRGSPHGPWAVPLVVVAVRLLLDPFALAYYRTGIWGPAFVGATLLVSQLVLFRNRRESYA